MDNREASHGKLAVLITIGPEFITNGLNVGQTAGGAANSQNSLMVEPFVRPNSGFPKPAEVNRSKIA